MGANITSFKFNCPNCTQKLEAESEWIGQTIQCPQCAKQIVIPDLALHSTSPSVSVNSGQLHPPTPDAPAPPQSHRPTTEVSPNGEQTFETPKDAHYREGSSWKVLSSNSEQGSNNSTEDAFKKRKDNKDLSEHELNIIKEEEIAILLSKPVNELTDSECLMLYGNVKLVEEDGKYVPDKRFDKVINEVKERAKEKYKNAIWSELILELDKIDIESKQYIFLTNELRRRATENGNKDLLEKKIEEHFVLCMNRGVNDNNSIISKKLDYDSHIFSRDSESATIKENVQDLDNVKSAKNINGVEEILESLNFVKQFFFALTFYTTHIKGNLDNVRTSPTDKIFEERASKVLKGFHDHLKTGNITYIIVLVKLQNVCRMMETLVNNNPQEKQDSELRKSFQDILNMRNFMAFNEIPIQNFKKLCESKSVLDIEDVKKMTDIMWRFVINSGIQWAYLRRAMKALEKWKEV